ncbi:MAG TPA: 5-oxoprolinase subunit PxpB [Vicinamibacterales bacterium]|nr:5-oxoprolinase subunit PxpB [Vicinamibacterales bacterium]
MTTDAIRAAGDAAVLLRLGAVMDPEVNARAMAVADAVRQSQLPGIRDVVSTIRSVVVYFDPVQVDLAAVSRALHSASAATPPASGGRSHEIAVAYGGDGGPDLAEVARWAQMSEQKVSACHAAAEYRVYMLGFQPGFAYLGRVDPQIAIGRRATPRLRVPAGSVGIAGRQTGIYPYESPGGWQIIGRALESVFDPLADRPVRFAPGDTVRFRIEPGTAASLPGRAVSGRSPASSARLTRSAPPDTARAITVLRPGLFTTVQCGSRWGRQSLGYPVSGPMDPLSHAIANLAVGNARDAAALEVTIAGPELRLEHDAMIAIAGANLSATLDGAPIPAQSPVSCRADSVLRFGERRTGARVYVAFDGGIEAEADWPVKPLVIGQVLGLRSERNATGRTIRASENLPAGAATLRVLPGPQDDVAPLGALEWLVATQFAISPQSNRMGYRLKGASALSARAEEMISDGTFFGAIQVPPSGDPILLMADRQTTGGYPQVATVISADLPRAGQLAPGDRVTFELCSHADAVAALAEQEAMLADGR